MEAAMTFDAFAKVSCETAVRAAQAEGLIRPTASSRVKGGRLVVVVGYLARQPQKTLHGVRVQGGDLRNREVYFDLPEPVVQLPLPSWLREDVTPGMETEAWVATSGPYSASMFVSEAYAAIEAYAGELARLFGSGRIAIEPK